MLSNQYKLFLQNITNDISTEFIFTDKLHTLAYGTDASFYRLIPKVVIKAQNSIDVQNILRVASKLSLPVTFRAAGTSLSGQAISDSILIVTARTWKDFRLSDDKNFISLEPSMTGSEANHILAPYGKKIGPDPASINSAMIGGIAANNASGMCCGIADNSYKTLKNMQIIFYDGTLLDTSCEISKSNFSKTHKSFLEKLSLFAQQTKENEALSNKITNKFKIKNTCGYGLNSLIDFEDVFEVLQHLIIGSEGTLAFIKEITYKTVEDHPQKASALVFFENTNEACNAVAKLKLTKKIKVDAVELMDRKALRSIENKEGMPSILKTLDDEVCTLLIETRALTQETLDKQAKKITKLLSEFKTVQDIQFTSKVEEYSLFWGIRKGLFPAVGAVREIGTSVIIEDVAFAIEDLAVATLELQDLFLKHSYDEALIFGHALEGNLHFVFTQDFDDAKEIKRYEDFMRDLTQMVAVKYKGSLKAEHGTGRNMAPFVELEWGIEAYDMMKKIKKLFDPYNLLNPGVIINDDEEIHLKNLKPLPKTNDLVDTCIECGFCENICPSNVITLTPRQRIVVSREISQLQDNNKQSEAKQLKEDYEYVGLDTCATCSLCSTQCPITIDTGSLTKHLRSQDISKTQNTIASYVANNFSTVLKGVKIGLKTSNVTHNILGTNNMGNLTSFLRKISFKRIPKWSSSLPKAIKINSEVVQKASDKKVVYFPSCVSRTMGNSQDDDNEEKLFDVTLKLLQRAGYEVIIPKSLENLCCGMPFSSKGFNKQAKQKSNELELKLLEASNNAAYPVLCDTSPCTKKMLESFEGNLDVYEPIEFALKYLVNDLKINKSDEPIVIHTTCSSRTMGLENKFKELANLCSSEVIEPFGVSCCGFAGDRGFDYPELNASALRDLKKQIPTTVKTACSTSRTCEIGLSEHSGLNYSSVFYLIEKCSRNVEIK